MAVTFLGAGGTTVNVTNLNIYLTALILVIVLVLNE